MYLGLSFEAVNLLKYYSWVSTVVLFVFFFYFLDAGVCDYIEKKYIYSRTSSEAVRLLKYYSGVLIVECFNFLKFWMMVLVLFRAGMSLVIKYRGLGAELL